MNGPVYRGPVIVALLGILPLFTCCTASQAPRYATQDIRPQLETLQTPQGADPAVMEMLKDELMRQLAGSEKVVSTPPTGAVNSPANLYFSDEGGGNYTFHWQYRNYGDYDQNGTVGVADITPIAVHFGHDGIDGLDVIINPDLMGVGVSCITAIAQNFGVELAYYAIEWSTAENGPDWTALQTVARQDGTGGDVGWLQFGYMSAYDPALWYRVTPFDSQDVPGQSSPAIQIGGSTGVPPTITNVDPRDGLSGASYSPMFSYDGDLPTSAAWDFGGGATPNTSNEMHPTVTLGNIGNYSASCTLTNAAGSDTFTYTLTVYPASADWQSYKIVSAANVGNYISFAFIDGLPAFAYVDSNDGKLHYVRTGIANPAFATDWTDMVVDETAGRWYDGEISLIYDNYLTPVILAYESTGSSAMFVGSNIITPETPADWESSVVRPTVDEVGSLTLAQGGVFATYKTPAGLLLAEATTYPPTDETSWEEVVVDGFAGSGSISKVKYNEEDGRFYVIAHNLNWDALRMSHCLFDDRMNNASWTSFYCSNGSAESEGDYFEFAFDPAMLSTDIYYVYYTQNPDQGFPMTVLGQEGAADKTGFEFNALEYNPGQFSGKFCSTALGNALVAVTYQQVDGIGLSLLVASYVSGTVPFGWVPNTVSDGSISPLTDTNVLFYNGNIVEVVYGREDGIYYASLAMN